MGRSQDYMSHYFDDMFDDEYNEYIRFKRDEARAQESYSFDNLINKSPKRMLPILGCVLGDYVGSRFEHDYPEFVDLGDYELMNWDCKFTDDTVFTIAIAEALTAGEATPEGFTSHLIKWGKRYPDAGFGRATQAWIASDNPQPYGSNRNGAAMRVAPCACFAKSLDEALELAKVSAEVSHNTPEGVAGAQAIAAAIYMALNNASKDEIRDYIQSHFNYNLDLTMEQLRERWSGFSCTAAETVPQAIICFLESKDVESAMRNGISLCSDADTLAAMAAAIAAPFYGELPMMRRCLDRMKEDMLNVLQDCCWKLSKI